MNWRNWASEMVAVVLFLALCFVGCIYMIGDFWIDMRKARNARRAELRDWDEMED